MNIKNIKGIIRQMLAYKNKLILANFIAVCSAAVAVFIPLCMPVLIDEVLLEKPAFIVKSIDGLFGSKQEPYVYILLVFFTVVFARLIGFVLKFFQTKLFVEVSEEVTYKLRKQILQKLQKVSLAGYEFFGSAKASSMAVVDVQTIDEFLSTAVSRFIISFLIIIGVSIVLFFINWKLALLILILNPFVAILSKKIAEKIAQLKKNQNYAYESFQEALSETLDLFSQIKAVNLEANFIEKITKKAASIKQKSISYKYKSDGANEFSYFLLLSAFEIIRAFSIFLVAYSSLSLGLMFAVFSYIWFIAGSSQEILRVIYSYQNAKAAMGRIDEIFNLPTEPEYKHLENPFKNTKTNSITLKNISFSYDDKNIILDNISLEIQKGKKTAIVGASGSGKTTLAQVIVGFYPFSSGNLYIDGIDVKNIGLDVVRENISLVLQNPQLFNDTIYNNISLGQVVSDEYVQKAIEISELKDFLSSLPDGLDTKIGKNGIKLSGGQRQRLSIARMIVQNPNVVILDESTSALDVHTEALVFNSLEKYLEGITTIIIAHRLSTVENADYIYVLEDGKIAEEGSKEKLLEKKGSFFSYYKKNKGEKV